jgi:NADH:ubiquinone oxidoreductase subunit K
VDSTALHLFWSYSVYIIIVFIIGLYCILATLNIVRVLIGIEVLMKAVTLLILISGNVSGHISLSQAMIITLIVIETVFIAVAMGIVLCVFGHDKSLDSRNLTNLKG